MMHRIQWHGLRLAEQLGVIGLLAITTGLFCLVFVFASWLPTRETLDAVRANQQSQFKQVVKSAATPSDNLQYFVGLLPKLSERATHIQSMMGQAKALNLAVDNVSYKTDHQPDSLLSKTYVDFTVYCTYPEMRTFLNNILTDMPFVSLDQLSINRDDVSSDVVEIRMRLTLHLVA